MHYHDIDESRLSKEIRCRDCGHVYFVRPEALSSNCDRCGNIAYHPPEAVAVSASTPTDTKTTSTKSLPLPKSNFTPIPAETRFVNSILLQNQQEWQLWGQLVQRFHDENNHRAYLTFIIHNELFTKAIERYSRHRKLFLGIAGERWQAEIADAQLESIQRACTVNMEREARTELPSLAWMDGLVHRLYSGEFRLRSGAGLFYLMLGLCVGAGISLILVN